LASLSNADLESYTVDLPVTLSGNFTSPQVSLNTQQAVTNLTQQIVATQKDKLKQQGEDKVKQALSGLLGGTKTTTDSTAVKTGKDSVSTTTNTTTEKVVKDVLGGLFGKKKATQDTTKTNN